jgi:hypothetical protein
MDYSRCCMAPMPAFIIILRLLRRRILAYICVSQKVPEVRCSEHESRMCTEKDSRGERHNLVKSEALDHQQNHILLKHWYLWKNTYSASCAI